jgi:hypothetical protein
MGEVRFPSEWIVFAPIGNANPALPEELLRTVPETIPVDGKDLSAQRVSPTRNQVDLKAFFGDPPYTVGVTS